MRLVLAKACPFLHQADLETILGGVFVGGVVGDTGQYIIQKRRILLSPNIHSDIHEAAFLRPALYVNISTARQIILITKISDFSPHLLCLGNHLRLLDLRWEFRQKSLALGKWRKVKLPFGGTTTVSPKRNRNGNRWADYWDINFRGWKLAGRGMLSLFKYTQRELC